MSTFFEDVNEVPPPMDEDEIKENYQKAQRKNYCEHMVQKYRRLRDGSCDSKDREKYADKVRQWKDKLKEINSISQNIIEKSSESGIIKSGARIMQLDSKQADEFAKMYYKEIRHFTTDCKKIAENLGKEESQIQKIKDYLFVDNSLYDPDDDEWRRFDPDCAIAQSWQRLINGKNILPHDRTLIEHEIYEMEIKAQNKGISHDDAHKIASQKYNYGKEANDYYAGLARNKKGK